MAENLNKALEDLNAYMGSDDGQLLLASTLEVYKFVAAIADCRRSRDRGVHKRIKMVCATVGVGASAVVLGAVIAPAAGAITVAHGAAVVSGATYVGAGAGVCPVVDNLAVFFGGSRHAHLVKEKILNLKEQMKKWDERVAAVNFAFEGLHSLKGFNVKAHLRTLLHTGALFNFGLSGVQATTGAFGAAAQAAALGALLNTADEAALTAFQEVCCPALGGMGVCVAEAGTAIARTAVYVASGIAIIGGLMSVLSMKQSQAEPSYMADSLDRQADEFAGLLHTMLSLSVGTEVHNKVVGQIPALLRVQVEKCELPPPDYRVGDKLRGTSQKEMLPAYLSLQIGPRRRYYGKEGSESWRVAPKVLSEVGCAILTRRFDSDVEFTLQGFRKADVQSLVRGDPSMGEAVRIPLDKDQEDDREYISDHSHSRFRIREYISDHSHSRFRISFRIMESSELTLNEQHQFLDHAKSNRWEDVKQMLEQKPTLVNVQPRGQGEDTRKRWSALHQAAWVGNAEIVSLLLSYGAATDATTEEKDGRCLTPLDVAIERGRDSIVVLLEQRKIHPGDDLSLDELIEAPSTVPNTGVDLSCFAEVEGDASSEGAAVNGATACGYSGGK